MVNIRKHLDSNEQIIQFFRPSRKAYLFQYFVYILLLVLGIVGYGYFSNDEHWFAPSASYSCLGLFIVMIVLLLRLEYRIWSRRYAITSERILYSRGIFSEQFKSARYNMITDVALRQSLWDKICNTGTLAIDTAGTDQYEIRYRKVNKPFELEKLINDRIPASPQKPTRQVVE